MNGLRGDPTKLTTLKKHFLLHKLQNLFYYKFIFSRTHPDIGVCLLDPLPLRLVHKLLLGDGGDPGLPPVDGGEGHPRVERLQAVEHGALGPREAGHQGAEGGFPAGRGRENVLEMSIINVVSERRFL